MSPAECCCYVQKPKRMMLLKVQCHGKQAGLQTRHIIPTSHGSYSLNKALETVCCFLTPRGIGWPDACPLKAWMIIPCAGPASCSCSATRYQADVVQKRCIGIWAPLFYLMAPCNSHWHMTAEGQDIRRNLTVRSDAVHQCCLASCHRPLQKLMAIISPHLEALHGMQAYTICCSSVVAAIAVSEHHPECQTRHSTRAQWCRFWTSV